MSETSTPPTGQPSPHPPRGNLLQELIITLLTPAFLAIAGGNLTHARAAAAETLAAYGTETRHDLITIAKIMAFGLATISSLSRSMDDDLTLSQILRLRSSANATDRSEHCNRQALEQSRARQAAEPATDAAALATTAQHLQQQTGKTPATYTHQPDAPPPSAAHSDATMHDAATWAASAAQVAAETAASLDTLPPEERHGAAIWVNVLNDIARNFSPDGIPPRPQSGNLGAEFHGA